MEHKIIFFRNKLACHYKQYIFNMINLSMRNYSSMQKHSKVFSLIYSLIYFRNTFFTKQKHEISITLKHTEAH